MKQSQNENILVYDFNQENVKLLPNLQGWETETSLSAATKTIGQIVNFADPNSFNDMITTVFMLSLKFSKQTRKMINILKSLRLTL